MLNFNPARNWMSVVDNASDTEIDEEADEPKKPKRKRQFSEKIPICMKCYTTRADFLARYVGSGGHISWASHLRRLVCAEEKKIPCKCVVGLTGDHTDKCPVYIAHEFSQAKNGEMAIIPLAESPPPKDKPKAGVRAMKTKAEPKTAAKLAQPDLEQTLAVAEELHTAAGSSNTSPIPKKRKDPPASPPDSPVVEDEKTFKRAKLNQDALKMATEALEVVITSKESYIEADKKHLVILEEKMKIVRAKAEDLGKQRDAAAAALEKLREEGLSARADLINAERERDDFAKTITKKEADVVASRSSLNHLNKVLLG